MIRKVLLLLAMVALLVVAASAAAAASQDPGFAKSHLEPVGGSGVHGTAYLVQLPSDGTSIFVLAKGLKPGKHYISLYYDNDHCALEPYSEDDIIGGPYTATQGGIGFTTGVADDELDEIHSVSVRSARTFRLLACARV